MLVFNYQQPKETRSISLPYISGHSAILGHQFTSFDDKPLDRPVRVVVRRLSGTGSIKIADRTVGTQTTEFSVGPTADAQYIFPIQVAEEPVSGTFIVHPDAPNVRPLIVEINTYEPRFDLVREQTEDGHQLTVQNLQASCSRFAVFARLSEVRTGSADPVCALRINHPSLRIVEKTSDLFNMRIRTLYYNVHNEKDKALALREMQAELKKAREIQRNLMPRQFPEMPGYEIFAFYKACDMVGGDYYDVIPLGPDHVGILVADVW